MTMLTTNIQGFAHVDINQVSIQPAIGGFELVFGLQLRTVTPDPNYWAVLHGAAAQIAGAHGAFVRLGQAFPSAPVRIRTTPNSLTSTCEFRLPLTAHQVAAIEELRDSGDLQIRLVISGEGGPVNHPERAENVHGELLTRVPQSVWIGELGVAKVMDVLLLEVPMPFVDPPPPHREMMAALRTAQRLFIGGNYSESVTRCRTAIEAMATLAGRGERWTGPVFDTLKERRQELTKGQRELVLEAALLHFTHLGAHPNEVQISRRDAKLALSWTASVLAYRAG